ncbi:MAG: molecular chaperone HtpG [Hyphomicrobiales bacterium]
MAKAAQKKAQEATEKHEFQAEVSRLLHLMVHSVYSEHEVFLRELISNAADACDKLRYEAIAQPELLAGDPDLKILISFDKKKSLLTVTDNGIGMNHDELVSNLGTIARSGTRAFMETTKSDGDEGTINLIGQFGVGFYSAFMVADKVQVYSRRAGDDAGWLWVSDGTGSFTIEQSGEAPERGTRIELKMRKKDKSFLDEMELHRIVRTYSDHIAIPITLAEIEKDKAGEETQLNSASALWTRPKSEITPEQYKEFFGHLSGLYADPALTVHYKAEGRHEYQVLLFVPGEQPFDLFDPERRGRLKLYVRRVFICDDADILPAYLRFVRGIIDSEDMPLNISREMLQNNPIVAQIRKAVTKRVLSELSKLAKKSPEDYAGMWRALGPVIKEGLYEDFERRDKLLALARFESTKSSGELRTLADYVADMKDDQKAIYYMTGSDAEALASSPQAEGFKARGIEILLLTDPVDNFWTTTAVGYDGKPFRSITQGASDLDDIAVEEGKDEEKSTDDASLATLISAMKTALGERVSDIRKSTRLTDSPVCLVAGEGGLDRNLEKILHAQKTTGVERTAPVLEINSNHALVKALAEKAGTTDGAGVLSDAAELLFDQAYILDGEPVHDPAGFARRMTSVLEKALG